MEERKIAKSQKEFEEEFDEPAPAMNDASRRVIGAAIEVHRIIGPGFPEIIYERALAIELQQRNIPFDRQPTVTVTYKGFVVGEGRLDFLVEGIVLELKSVYMLLPVHRAQLHASLKASGHRLGLLFNFDASILQIRRVIESQNP